MSAEDSDTSESPQSPSSLSHVSSIFHSHLSQPESFLSPSPSTYTHCVTALRTLHNLALSLHPTPHTLSHLYTEGFDQEQIWQQLELWNAGVCDNLQNDIEQLLTADIKLSESPQLENTANGDVSESSEGDKELESDEESGGEAKNLGVANSDSNRFFNPELMEKFLVSEEKKFYQEDRPAESSEGDTPDLSEGEEAVAADMKYEDYFVDEEKGAASDKKSSYTQLKEKLQTRIQLLEEDNVAQKDWKLGGEVRSKSRPENSLLEEYMEHQSHPPAPLITNETTESLEEMIRRRVRDELWDDPVRREKPSEKSYNRQTGARRSDREQVEGEARKGLAEVYEEEYQRRADPGAAVQRGEEKGMEEEIKKMMKDLFSKLDALSNFRYTPSPYKHEPIVITNTPAVCVEEVLPSAMSEAMRMAPEEIVPPSRHAPASEIERTKEDKKRSRRQKKRALSRSMVLRAQKLVNRSNPGLGNTYSKRKLMDALRDAKQMQGQRDKLLSDEKKGKGGKSFRSSKAFFAQLESQAKSAGKSDKSDKRDRRKKELMRMHSLKFS